MRDVGDDMTDDAKASGLQRWRDKLELAELVAILSSAVDRGDVERIASCYAEDSYDDHGTFKGTGREFAEFVGTPGPMSTMHHLIGQSIFDVEGDEAWGETFYGFNGTVGTTRVSGQGRYADYFRRIGLSWKLVYRRVLPDAVPAGDDPSAYWKPSRGRDDPSYDRKRGPGG
jgi:SnoaL-like domain